MSLLSALRSMGAKLKLIQAAEPSAAKAAPIKIQTRAVTLKDLTSQIRSDRVKALAELPAELSVGFEKVFEAAGIKPTAQGWTVDRLRQLLQTPQYRVMARSAAQAAILGLLAAEKVSVEDLVKDAVARDQALDAFEKFARKKMDDRLAARRERAASIEDQIRTLEADLERFKAEFKTDEDHWQQWRGRKLACEQDLAWAIGYLMDKPVVTIDAPADKK